MLPTVHEVSADPAANMLVSVERLLTLAVPNTYFWLLGFYAFFHLTLNLLAEVRPTESFVCFPVICRLVYMFSFVFFVACMTSMSSHDKNVLYLVRYVDSFFGFRLFFVVCCTQ